jgi:membrane-associated protease RseP (regulator of RpoE activity)
VDPYLGYEIALVLVLAYGAVVYLLWRNGRLGPDRALSLFGPALMSKTQRGRSFLDRVGRPGRFWSRLADVGIVLGAIAMVTIVATLILGAIASFRLSPAQAPSPAEAVGLPGINPIIPLSYGIVALVVGIVVHELFHGFVARSQRIGVKSLGILWFVVPIGAFVEQDDAEMLAAPRRQRDRVAAAGVLANFLLAVVFFAALSVVLAGSIAPNANGVGIASVEANSPAANATLATGDIITAVNGTSTPTLAAFQSALAQTRPGESVAVVFYSGSAGTTETRTAVLGTNPSNASRGFLGVTVYGLTPADLKQVLVWPAGSSSGFVTGSVDWLVLPLAGLEPVSGTTAGFFHVSGPLAAGGTTWFWAGANTLYWLAWMNLLLGLSNALPLVPLDGGLLFRDFASSIAARFRKGWSAARLDEFGGRAAAVSTALVLVLLVWQFVVPRLV